MARISRIFVSLAPIYIFSKLCGFADFHIDSNGRFTFSDKLFVVSCAYHTLMVCVLFYVLVVTRDNIFGPGSTTLIVFNAGGLTILFIVDKICQKFYEKKKITPLWKNLGGLQRKMAALNMELEFGKISLQSALSFIPTQIVLTGLVATQYYISFTLSSSKMTALTFALILYLIESERTVITGQYCSLLILIRNMLEAITRKLNNIRISENPQTTFRFLSIFHHELCKAARKTNKLYNVHLVLSFSVDFLCFVTYTQLVVYDFMEGNMTNAGALSLIWMLVLCSRIIPIVTASHSCVAAVSISYCLNFR